MRNINVFRSFVVNKANRMDLELALMERKIEYNHGHKYRNELRKQMNEHYNQKQKERTLDTNKIQYDDNSKSEIS